MTEELVGKVVMVTGASSGIGRAAAVALARRGARLVLAGRSEERMRPVLADVAEVGGTAGYVPLDLASLAAVREAAAEFLAHGLPLHLLVNDAGIAGRRGITADGFERTFGVNYVGPWLLTRLLLPALQAAAPSRIVTVASDAHRQVAKWEWTALRSKTPRLARFRAYGVSKLANILMTRELAVRLAGTGVTPCAVHPGVVATGIWQPVPQPIRGLMTRRFRTPEQGAAPVVWCATTSDVAPGGYYADERPREVSELARDETLAAELWRWTEEAVAEFLG